MQWDLIVMFNQKNKGSAAPLALLFTLVSMSFTVAYLKNSFSQSAMEKYRYTEWKALYAAEAGLNDVGVVVLPYIVSDTLLIPDGVVYGKDENNLPIGMYKDIACSTQLIPNTTRKEYVAYSTGVADYVTPSGNNVSIERRVYTSMVPQGFEEFMYFTHEELPIGPGNTGVVNFGSGDELEGKVHTNGNMTFSNYGCPDFSGEVNITFEAIEQYGNAINWGGCNDDIFEDDDGNTILDTVSQIIFPPDNSAEIARSNATRTFIADNKLFRSGKKDTLIMTEIHFTDGGYWATQWLYNIPPIGTPPAEFSYVYDSSNVGLTVNPTGLHLSQIYEEGSYGLSAFLTMDGTTTDGVNVASLVSTSELTIDDGDLIVIRNEDNSKIISFTADGSATGNAIDIFGEVIVVRFYQETLNYVGPEGEGFNDDEPVTFVNTSASSGDLDEGVEWNSPLLYHDHDTEDASTYCEAGGRQHFDFDYWTAGGSCDIFNCPDEIYNSEYVYMGRTFFSRGNSPQVIYIKGGQVLVRGTVDGQYTIVTDDYTEYRRHDDNSIIDRVWGNIWLIDDVIYQDSFSNGQVIHPQNGGTNHVLGLIAGGSVIIANTRPNGARGGQYSSHIKINAAILAMNGGFISHYWQNTLFDYHNYNDGWPNYPAIGDGRGGHRNHYRPDDQSGIYTGNDDIRGTVYLWGSIVQFRRGYMKRNYPGPYNVSPGVGYDKNYHYDWNLRLKPPPYFPDLQSTNNTVILKMASYGEAKKQYQD